MSKPRRLTDEALYEFFYGIHTMFKSGYPLSDCISLMAEEESSRKSKSLFESLSKQVEEGVLFSEALKSSRVFPSHTTALISVGENVGKLEESIGSVAKYHKDRHRIKKQIKDALTYPLILVFLMAVIICVLLIRVIPVFNEVYASLGGSMTGVAGGILLIGEWLKTALPTICTVLIIAIILFVILMIIPFTKRMIKNVFYSLAGNKGPLLSVNRANFASALSMAIVSGFSFEEGILFASRLFDDNISIKKRVSKAVKMLGDGAQPEDVLLRSKLLPTSSCKLLKIGMRSGSADETMTEISERLNDEAERKIFDTVAVIEPALVIITSLITGIILLTVMLPLIDIMNVI